MPHVHIQPTATAGQPSPDACRRPPAPLPPTTCRRPTATAPHQPAIICRGPTPLHLFTFKKKKLCH
ncbi:unnamed protein product [Prunus armeniaca]